MKIKEIRIYDRNLKLKRHVTLSDTYFIIGDISEEQNNNKEGKKTTNALGKSTLIIMISYMLAGNNVKQLDKLKGYKCEMTINIDGVNRIISRIIGEKSIILDGYKYNLESVKEIFSINRLALNHIIHIEARKDVILEKPSKEQLYNSAIELLELGKLSSLTRQFIEVHNEFETVKARKSHVESQISSDESIDQAMIAGQLSEIDKKLNSIENLNEGTINSQYEEISKERYELHNRLNELQREKEFLLVDLSTIDNYLEESMQEPKEIIRFIESANKELGEFLRLKMEDALDFHRSLSAEHTERLIKNKKAINIGVKKIENEIMSIGNEIPKLENIIDENHEIRQIFKIQNSLNQQKTDLLAKNSFLSELNKLEKEEISLRAQKSSLLADIAQIDLAAVNEKYFEFTRKIVESIYPDNYGSYFKIDIIKANKLATSKYPLVFNFKIEKDDSDGVRNARNFIVDLLMLEFSNSITFMIWDSSVFNETDTNQVYPLLEKSIEIAKRKDKQIIIALNKFQLGEHYNDFIDGLNENDKLILNTDNRLLDIDF